MLYLKDPFNSLSLRVVTFITVQLAMRVADKLQKPLGLNVYQHGVLEGTAVLRERLEAALSNPFLKKPQERQRERRNVTAVNNVSDPQALVQISS